MEEATMWDQARPAQLSNSRGSNWRATHERPQASGLDAIAVITRRNRGEEIHAWEGTDEYWYRVISGAAKLYVVLPGGRRQIIDLLLPNDFFGFSPHLNHYCTLEAVVNDTAVACYPRNRAESLAESDPQVGRQVREMVSEAVARLQELILTLGRTTAREKVGSFLLKMTERTSKLPTDRLMLLTSRYDIADYLALSVETVSRSLTDLRQRGLIALAGPRRVRIVNRHGLEEADNAGDIEAPRQHADRGNCVGAAE
jgi:CRP-like cAMP-binding protein